MCFIVMKVAVMLFSKSYGTYIHQVSYILIVFLTVV